MVNTKADTKMLWVSPRINLCPRSLQRVNSGSLVDYDKKSLLHPECYIIFVRGCSRVAVDNFLFINLVGQRRVGWAMWAFTQGHVPDRDPGDAGHWLVHHGSQIQNNN